MPGAPAEQIRVVPRWLCLHLATGALLVPSPHARAHAGTGAAICILGAENSFCAGHFLHLRGVLIHTAPLVDGYRVWQLPVPFGINHL